MTVDFAFGKMPKLRLATLAWTGPWNEKKIRAQFERIDRWLRKSGARPGRWVFREPGARKWEVGIEVRGNVAGSDGIRVRTLPATDVARVVFNPDEVSPRVLYHGIADWLRWRKREKEVRSVGNYREVYAGNPWKDPRAWARTEIQVVVRR